MKYENYIKSKNLNPLFVKYIYFDLYKTNDKRFVGDKYLAKQKFKAKKSTYLTSTVGEHGMFAVQLITVRGRYEQDLLMILYKIKNELQRLEGEEYIRYCKKMAEKIKRS